MLSTDRLCLEETIKNMNDFDQKLLHIALAGVAQWLEYRPVTERLQIGFLVRAHAYVVGSSLVWVHTEATN